MDLKSLQQFFEEGRILCAECFSTAEISSVLCVIQSPFWDNFCFFPWNYQLLFFFSQSFAYICMNPIINSLKLSTYLKNSFKCRVKLTRSSVNRFYVFFLESSLLESFVSLILIQSGTWGAFQAHLTAVIWDFPPHLLYVRPPISWTLFFRS